MDVNSYSETRERLKEMMDQVVAYHQPVEFSRQKAKSFVLVSLADWHEIEETLHLLSSPKNAKHLKSSIEELNAGNGFEGQLIETGNHAPHLLDPSLGRRSTLASQQSTNPFVHQRPDQRMHTYAIHRNRKDRIGTW